jgi:hypothetical protein
MKKKTKKPGRINKKEIYSFISEVIHFT